MKSFASLPDDVLYVIFTYCNGDTLRKLCQVCHRFRQLASRDCFWIQKSRKCLVTNQVSEGMRNRSCCLMSSKEQCRVALNWQRKKCTETFLLQHQAKYLPWIQMNSETIWVSKGNEILVYRHRCSKRIERRPLKVLRGHHEDVCRFAVSDNLVVSGGCDYGIYGWSAQTGKQQFSILDAHEGNVNCVDVFNSLVISGSRDRIIKVWNVAGRHLRERQRFLLEDRVLSLSVNPTGEMFVCGTAGCYGQPLLLYCLTTGQRIAYLGDRYQYGAGVLHCLYENQNNLFTCGYDTYIRYWDTRTNLSSAIRWENPFDQVVYCMASDHNVTFVSGSAGHGLVWLWDKRSTRPVQMYYVGENSDSPVYSIAFDPCHLYVALDRSLRVLNFT